MQINGDVTPVGRIILQRLADQRISQAELARTIGMNYKLLNQCVYGWRRIPRYWLPVLGEALGLEGRAYDRFVLEALQHPARSRRGDGQFDEIDQDTDLNDI